MISRDLGRFFFLARYDTVDTVSNPVRYTIRFPATTRTPYLDVRYATRYTIHPTYIVHIVYFVLYAYVSKYSNLHVAPSTVVLLYGSQIYVLRSYVKGIY